MTDTIKGSRKEVRKFGVTFFILGACAGAYFAWRQKDFWPWFAGGGLAFLLAGLFGYPLLRPVYIGWMKIAHALAWVNTRLLLSVFFYLIVTPTGLLMRLVGKDLLDEKIDRSAQSYWKQRDRQPVPKERYERLF